PHPHSPFSPLQRTQHNTHTRKSRARGRRRRLAASSVAPSPPPLSSQTRERECDDERGGAVTKRVAAARGASRFAVAVEGKEELLLSRQSLSCFLVADEGAARTVAVAEEGDTREGAVTVVAIVAEPMEGENRRYRQVPEEHGYSQEFSSATADSIHSVLCWRCQPSYPQF
ncbi:hypothetical protein HN873_039867, partial [Arachis hypogaea]